MRIYIFIFLSTIIVITNACNSLAQVSNLLFLNQAISAAIENDPFIQAKRIELGLTPSELADISSSQLNPFFTFDADPGSKSYKIGLAKTFMFGGVRKKRVEIAKKRNELEEIALKKQILEIKNKTRNAFIEHYINQKKLEQFNTELDQVKQAFQDKAIKCYKEDIQLKMVMLNLENEIQKTNLRLLETEIALEEITGHALQTTIKLKAPLELPEPLKGLLGDELTNYKKLDKNKLEKIAFKNRPEIAENKIEIEISKLQQKLARTKRIPLLILETGWRFSSDPTINNVYIEGDIEMPFIYRHTDEINAAKRDQKIYEDNINETKESISREINNIIEYIVLSKNNLDNFEKDILPEIEQLMKEFIESFGKDRCEFTEIIQAEQIKANIIDGYFLALKNYQGSISDLEEVLGLVEEQQSVK